MYTVPRGGGEATPATIWANALSQYYAYKGDTQSVYDVEIEGIRAELGRGFKLEEGPFIKELDKCSKEFSCAERGIVWRHACWLSCKQLFEGKKCMDTCIILYSTTLLSQPQNIAALCQSTVEIAERVYSICPSLSQQFQCTFSIFAVCHKLYSTKHLSEEKICLLG